MQNTKNYGLRKPEARDFYDVEDQNANMDLIDGKLKENADMINGVRQDLENLTAEDVGALPITGGVLRDALKIAMADNGYSQLLKNHSDKDDYGLYITDISKDGKNTKIVLSSAVQDNGVQYGLRYVDRNGEYHFLYGDHFKPTATDVGAPRLLSYSLGGGKAMSFTFPASDNTIAYVSARGWNVSSFLDLMFSGYATGGTRQKLTVLSCDVGVACGLNKENATGHGFTIKNTKDTAITICIVLLAGSEPTTELTEANASLLSSSTSFCSTQVVISETAPTNASVLWVDSSAMKMKIYKNGAWTALS